MSEKPILVTLSRDNGDDLVSFTDASGAEKMRTGLVRCVPYSILDKTFLDLMNYMCDPAGADGNPPYQGKELELAITYQGEHVENAQGALAARRGGVKLETLIGFSEPVSAHFSRIVEQKTLQTATGPMDCKGIDLILTKKYSGGVCNRLNQY